MYIELFLLDNLLMNLLVLRLACALCARPCTAWRMALGALGGAAYAYLTLRAPMAGHWFIRLACAALMGLSIPCGKKVKAFLCAWAAILLAACLLGGLLLLLSFSDQRGAAQGLHAISWRVALAGICAAAFLPNLWRRKRGWGGTIKLCVAYGGVVYKLPARFDSGNCLKEPLSGLPVIVADIGALREKATIPVPAATVQGNVVLYALKADLITLNGMPTDALLALSKGRLDMALVPPAAVA